jgi:hypothetical protein
MQGMKINAKAIAEGMYRMFDEDDRAVLAFGMIPKKWIDVLEKMLAERRRAWRATSASASTGSGPILTVPKRTGRRSLSASARMR